MLIFIHNVYYTNKIVIINNEFHDFQPLIAKQITNSTKASSDCHQSTLRKRSRVLEDVRSALSLGHPSTHMRDELKCHQEELGEILPECISIPAEDILELKGFFGFSWARLRKLKR